METATQERLGYKDFQAFGRWYSNHRRRTTGRPASPTTVRTKQVWAAVAANHLGLKDEVLLGTSVGDRASAEKVMSHLEARLTPGALRQAVYALQTFSEYAVSQGWIDEAVITAKDIPSKNPQAPIVVYTPSEMESYVSAARGYDLRWWALMCFLVDTGRRIGETLGLQWSWFRLDMHPAYIELPTTKNGEPQYVPLTDRLVNEVFTPEHIATLKADNKAGKLAFHRDPAIYPFPLSYRSASQRLERLARVAGLPNRGFHAFRHTVITQRLAAGWPIQAVAALAGHRSVSTTDQRYNHTHALSYAGLLNPTPAKEASA